VRLRWFFIPSRVIYASVEFYLHTERKEMIYANIDIWHVKECTDEEQRRNDCPTAVHIIMSSWPSALATDSCHFFPAEGIDVRSYNGASYTDEIIVLVIALMSSSPSSPAVQPSCSFNGHWSFYFLMIFRLLASSKIKVSSVQPKQGPSYRYFLF
jgi:hypothetical protein